MVKVEESKLVKTQVAIKANFIHAEEQGSQCECKIIMLRKTHRLLLIETIIIK